jgi:hypothetical protein
MGEGRWEDGTLQLVVTLYPSKYINLKYNNEMAFSGTVR